jgi:hypothetical protein
LGRLEILGIILTGVGIELAYLGFWGATAFELSQVVGWTIPGHRPRGI